jgi:aminopeptidase N
MTHAQHQDKVDFINGTALTVLKPKEKSIDGKIAYSYNILTQVDSIFLDAINMEFSEVTINDKKVDYSYDGKKIVIFSKFEKGQSDTLSLTYKVTPKQTVYFSGWSDEIEGNEQVWTQGQGKYTSHWLPSFDHMEEKVEFDLNFMVDGENNYTILSNGILKEKGDFMGTPIWLYDMRQPMSSYLLAFAIGNYEKQKLKSKSGIPIENYYYPQDSLKVEPTYRYTKEIFDFLEEEIGVPYPWQNYKQIPVRDFLYAGMENTTATIFSDGYVIDSTAFVDKNYANVNAHELAHQWFGNLVTEKNGNHHWLHEGFATYYAQLAEKELFGDDHYYWKLYSSLIALQNTIEMGEGQRLTDPKASSLVFYEKGAWALYVLRNQVGEVAFKTGLKNYLNKHQFKNVTISDFLLEIETASGQDLSNFKKDWLENEELPIQLAKDQLQKDSESLKQLFAMENEFKAIESDDVDYEAYWNKTTSVHLRKHLLENYNRVLPEAIFSEAFESDTIPIRQVLSRKMDSIPNSLKSKYETLLADNSYVTIENALFKLWSTYPEEKAKYLEQTKDIIGLPNKNVRLLWLTLAIVTNDYNARKTQDYFLELSGYTSERYGSEVRMGAFQYLHQAVGLNNASLKSLIKATTHHSWQFKKFARNLVDELLKDADYEVRLQEIAKELNEEEVRYINTKLDK